ncbi:GDP-L-fucose synthase [Prochlorococcus sp. AH-736-E20]|nr:GDP-L-fucose synthase [Prochlorococcus sp. AH-736-E20]
MAKLISPGEKIFIAGSTGMVGNAILKVLLNNGYGDKSCGGEILTPSRKELNLLKYGECENWFENHKPSVVIIAAAKVGGIFANSSRPKDFLLENLKMQTNIIELSFLNNVKRLIFLGSSCIYPKFAKQPIKEESLLSGELEKTNEWYAIAKIAGIKLCEALRIQEGFDSICLMPTNLYGPLDNYHLQDSHVMAALIRKFHEAKQNNSSTVKCWGSGKPQREFMHVDDLAEAVKFVIEYWDPTKEKLSYDENLNKSFFLNVGTGKDISILDLANLIAKKTSYKGEIIWDKSMPDGTPRKLLDVSRLSKLGWKPKINLEKGIEMTIESFKKEIESGICRI